MKIAKISLVADISGFKQKLAEATRSFSSFEKLIKRGGSSSGSFPSGGGYSAAGPGGPTPYMPPPKALQQVIMTGGSPWRKGDQLKGSDFGKDLSSLGGMAGGTIGKVLGGLGLTAGVAGAAMLYNRRLNIAQDNLKIRALTGGDTVSGRSGLGFTSAERRQRAMGIAGALGRNMGGSELSGLTNYGESLERAHGVGADQQADFLGSARRSGQDTKFMADTVGGAVAAKLTGSRVGEYLQSMSQALEQMSQGVNIDANSLNGFASELTKMPFFHDNPARGFQTAQTLNSVFSNGDRYQQAQAARSILASVPGAGPAGIELRRSRGLFGAIKKGDIDRYKQLGFSPGAIGALSLSPNALIGNMFNDAMKTSGGNTDMQFMQFQEKTGLKGDEAFNIFHKIKTKGVGSLTAADQKSISNAGLSPTDRLAKTFSGVDSEFVQLRTKIDDLINQLADKVAIPINRLGDILANGIDAVDHPVDHANSWIEGKMEGAMGAIGGVFGLKKNMFNPQVPDGEAVGGAAAGGMAGLSGADDLTSAIQSLDQTMQKFVQKVSKGSLPTTAHVVRPGSYNKGKP